MKMELRFLRKMLKNAFCEYQQICTKYCVNFPVILLQNIATIRIVNIFVVLHLSGIVIFIIIFSKDKDCIFNVKKQ